METIKVKDLMVPLDQYAVISEDASLYEAVLVLEQTRQKCDSRGYRHRAVLVCDKKNKICGKLGHLDVLRSLEPKYGEIGDLRRVSGFGLSAEFLRSMIDTYELWKTPLDDLCRKASEIKVGSIVKSPLEGEVIDTEASVNKAVHQLIMGHHQSLLVTSDDHIVGVLRLTDVFEEVTKRIKACAI